MVVLFAASACGFSAHPAAAIDANVPDVAVDVPTGCRVVEVAAGGDHTCARTNDGAVECWGRAHSGEVGVPTTMKCVSGGAMYLCAPKPVVVGVTGAVALGIGSYHSCAATVGGTFCWGYNQYGAFGDGMTQSSSTPLRIAARTSATALDAGRYHTCSLAGGTVSCSGQDLAGEVGDNATTVQPNAVSVFQNAVKLAAGDYLSCAIDGSRALSCWGRNAYREIDASGTSKLVPTPIAGITDAVQVAAGLDHICVVHADQSATCWGSNTAGQLGNGMPSMYAQPAVSIGTALSVSADRNHTCVLHGDGTITCFGESYGATPVTIPLPGPATSITAGSRHDCALTQDGAAWCWGDQDFGQLGDGTVASTRTLTPVQSHVCP